LQIRKHAGRLLRRIVRSVAVLGVVIIVGTGALLAALWLEHRSELTLPTPTGPSRVGRATYVWTDGGTADALAPGTGAMRELLAWIWYPAVVPAGAATDDYVSPDTLRAIERAHGPRNVFSVLMSDFLTRDASRVRANSVRDADVAPQQRAYPVVILRAGASAGVTNYSTLAEDLASHGFVVVGFDAPYRTGLVVFPDGRTIGRSEENNPERCVPLARDEQARCVNRIMSAWTADIAFALDQLARMNVSDASGRFTGRLDMSRVGVFGHSFGGATAAQFCHEDSRCRAAIDIDGAPHGTVIGTGLQQPFLFLLSDHGNSSDPVTRQIEADIQSIYDRVPADRRLRIEIRGANHFTFSDDGALLKSRFVRGVLRVLGQLGIDGTRQLAVTAYCVRTFFDAHLNGASIAPLTMASQLYPELQVIQ
jgi:predicted dienelactone hydrolase